MESPRAVQAYRGPRSSGRLPSRGFLAFAALALLLALPGAASADELDSGDTAWMLTSTVLVLFMTIPGLSLFYGGLVRTKNVLSVLMQCFAITGLMSIVWVLWGYSIAFDTTGMEAGVTNFSSFAGGLSKAFLSGVGADSMSGTIPETVFVTFQMTFAIITPALIVGAFAERMKFTATLLFMAIWSTVVYAPVCHMAWSGDGSFFGDRGVLDFAGGTVVHINAGVAALVAALVVGKRQGYPDKVIPPHSTVLTVVGASMLWVGWFGFNAGSAVAADGAAGMAMLVTQVATASAALGWMIAEWIKHGKASVLGMATGAVAGLVAITPASGSVGPMGAIAIGLASGTHLLLGRHEPQAVARLRRFARCFRRARGGWYRRCSSDRRLRRREPRGHGAGKGFGGRSARRADPRRRVHHRLLRGAVFHHPQDRGRSRGIARLRRGRGSRTRYLSAQRAGILLGLIPAGSARVAGSPPGVTHG